MVRRVQSPTVATFSICATDGRDFGVAVASKFLAVGSVVPWAGAGIGALATQAMANTSYGPSGLQLLSEGLPAQQVVERLTAADPDRDHRQLGIVDRDGGSWTYTGSACFDWAGGRTAPGCACQGNILSGPEVADALLDTFLASSGDLCDRLLAALSAADEAGGDRRGRESAALLVVRKGGGYGGLDDRMIDLRVDDHPEPVMELQRLARLWRVYFEETDDGALLPVDEELVRRLRLGLQRRGIQVRGEGLDSVFLALEAWAGMENLEERLRGRDRLDPVVLRMLEGQL
ncbi:MAG: DUF1028 domain-containing protein [Candidatus Dormibacteraeota bacterium]|nr:DUF1028 domain-containing protein [Candidatus Dormibacteraeota bacterium]